MAPTNILFIRHAEKPVDGGASGVTSGGTPDPESLIPRGWQRAGALARYFCPVAPTAAQAALVPTIVFASGIGPKSRSQRPIETVSPLVDLLNQIRETPFVTSHLKDDHKGLVADILSRSGVVLVAWEHSAIPALISLIPQAPAVPQTWPDDRFDVVWVLGKTQTGWSFSQKPQLLLSGDSSTVIS